MRLMWRSYVIIVAVLAFFSVCTPFVQARDAVRIMRTRFNPSRSWTQYLRNVDLYITKPTKRKHVFIASGSSVKDVFEQQKPKAVINGSYFRRDSGWLFYPAWAFVQSGKTIAKSSFCDDPNICALFNTSTMDIKPIVYSGEYDGSRRSAGPMLLQSWVVNIQLKKNFSHRSRKTQRTVLVTPWPYFVYTQRDYTLYEFAKVLKRLFPSSTIVNLDWWSSTSFYSSAFQFNSKKLLPEFFILY